MTPQEAKEARRRARMAMLRQKAREQGGSLRRRRNSGTRSGDKTRTTMKTRGISVGHKAPRAFYNVVCKGPDGKVKWTENAPNHVTTEGQDVLLMWLAGATTTVPSAVYVVLNKNDDATSEAFTYTGKGTGVGQWDELTEYSEANRPTWTHYTPPIVATSLDNSASPADFSINTNGISVYGAGLVFSWTDAATISTKGDTAAANAVLYSMASFASVKNVDNGDTLSVTVTITQDDDGI